MIYPIVKFGDPVLEKPAATVTAFDEELKKLIEDMFESMYAARGVGLAAPQIGISKRIAVVDVTFKEDPDAKLVLINPEIIGKEGRQRGSEGCLSIPEFREDVSRAKIVTVRAQDAHGEVFRAHRRRSAGARLPARDRSPKWQALYLPHQRAETRLDQAQDQENGEGGRMVEGQVPGSHALSSHS